MIYCQLHFLNFNFEIVGYYDNGLLFSFVFSFGFIVNFNFAFYNQSYLFCSSLFHYNYNSEFIVSYYYQTYISIYLISLTLERTPIVLFRSHHNSFILLLIFLIPWIIRYFVIASLLCLFEFFIFHYTLPLKSYF